MTPCQACHKPFQHSSLSRQCLQFCKMKIGPQLLSPMTRAWFTYSVSEPAELKILLNGSFLGTWQPQPMPYMHIPFSAA